MIRYLFVSYKCETLEYEIKDAIRVRFTSLAMYVTATALIR